MALSISFSLLANKDDPIGTFYARLNYPIFKQLGKGVTAVDSISMLATLTSQFEDGAPVQWTSTLDISHDKEWERRCFDISLRRPISREEQMQRGQMVKKLQELTPSSFTRTYVTGNSPLTVITDRLACLGLMRHEVNIFDELEMIQDKAALMKSLEGELGNEYRCPHIGRRYFITGSGDVGDVIRQWMANPRIQHFLTSDLFNVVAVGVSQHEGITRDAYYYVVLLNVEFLC